MAKFKILFPLFPLAKMTSSVIFKKGFTSKHRKYQKQEKKKAEVTKENKKINTFEKMGIYQDSYQL